VTVVDDDPRVLESLDDLFQSAGYRVRRFSSATSLIENGISDIDVLITDISMPGMDGFGLRDFVRKMRPELPIFFITARHELVDQNPVRGPGGFFRKPFDGQALLTAVGDALRISGEEDGDDKY
jgi:FixJ family two-component response regulator